MQRTPFAYRGDRALLALPAAGALEHPRGRGSRGRRGALDRGARQPSRTRRRGTSTAKACGRIRGPPPLLYCEAARSGDADAALRSRVDGRQRPRRRPRRRGRGGAVRVGRAGGPRAGAEPAGGHRGRTGRAAGLHAATGAGGAPTQTRPQREPVPPPDPFADLPPWKQRIADQVERYAPRYAVEPRLALAVIAAESNFDHLAVSPKGAQGLMQLIPETATRFNVSAPFDMRENLRGGLAYLRWLLAYYRGNVELAVAAYNAGERAVDKYGGVPPLAIRGSTSGASWPCFPAPRATRSMPGSPDPRRCCRAAALTGVTRSAEDDGLLAVEEDALLRCASGPRGPAPGTRRRGRAPPARRRACCSRRARPPAR